MRKKRVTLSDVALHAGVSPTTASFVLTGRDDQRISEATRERVRLASQQLGYRPNLTARGLRSSSSMSLGLISDSIAETQYAGDMLRGAIEAAAATDRMLFIAETGDETSDGDKQIEAMLDRQIDGLVYATMYTRSVSPPDSLSAVPHVFLNCLPDRPDGPMVLPDEYSAGRCAAVEIIEAGVGNCVHHIGGTHAATDVPEGIYAGHERLRGINDMFAERGQQLANVWDVRWQPQEGYRVVTEILAAGTVPSALICANDRLAFGAYQALTEARLRIPDDVSVISFDDSELAAWLRPSLTSIALPHYRLGETAVRLLMNDHLEPIRYLIPMRTSTRDSLPRPSD